MRLLALDTATEACSVALLTGESLWVREEEPGRRAAELILGMVDALLAEAGVALKDLDGIAFGRGPGGFTGVRLAASVTQGLAFGAGLPVVPVSDLAALAQRALDAEPGACRVLALSDARMQEVYWGCYERGADHGAALLGAEHVGAPQTVRLPPPWCHPGAPAVLAAGRGLAVAPGLTERLAPHLAADAGRATWLPRAREIAQLGARLWARGERLPAEEALPLYLRDDVVRSPGA